MSANLLPATATTREEGKSESALTTDQMKEVAKFILSDSMKDNWAKVIDLAKNRHTEDALVTWVQNSPSFERPPQNGCFNEEVFKDIPAQVKALLNSEHTTYSFANGQLIVFGPGATKIVGKYIDLKDAKQVAKTFSKKDIASLQDETNLHLMIGVPKADVTAINSKGIEVWKKGTITASIGSFSPRP